MSSVHDPSHEALLERWVAGEPLTAEEQALLAGCEACRQHRSEIEEVSAELEQLGTTERDSEIEKARRSAAPEWEDRALGSLERTMRGDPGARSALPRRRLLVGLAAAAAVIVSLFFLKDSGSGPEPFWLEQEGVKDMSPAGEVETVEAFSWTHDTPPLGSYEIHLYLRGESSAFHSATTYETRWLPDLSAPLPQRFFWELRAFDAEGDEVAFGRAEVFFSP